MRAIARGPGLQVVLEVLHCWGHIRPLCLDVLHVLGVLGHCRVPLSLVFCSVRDECLAPAGDCGYVAGQHYILRRGQILEDRKEGGYAGQRRLGGAVPLIGRRSRGARSWGPLCRAGSRCLYGRRWRGWRERRRCLDHIPVRLRDWMEMALAHLGRHLRGLLQSVGFDLRLHSLEATLNFHLHVLVGDRLESPLDLLLHLLWGDGHQLWIEARGLCAQLWRRLLLELLLLLLLLELLLLLLLLELQLLLLIH